MMALNTASDSPGDTIIPCYYVLRRTLRDTRFTNTPLTVILLGGSLLYDFVGLLSFHFPLRIFRQNERNFNAKPQRFVCYQIDDVFLSLIVNVKKRKESNSYRFFLYISSKIDTKFFPFRDPFEYFSNELKTFGIRCTYTTDTRTQPLIYV